MSPPPSRRLESRDWPLDRTFKRVLRYEARGIAMAVGIAAIAIGLTAYAEITAAAVPQVAGIAIPYITATVFVVLAIYSVTKTYRRVKSGTVVTGTVLESSPNEQKFLGWSIRNSVDITVRYELAGAQYTTALVVGQIPRNGLLPLVVSATHPDEPMLLLEILNSTGEEVEPPTAPICQPIYVVESGVDQQPTTQPGLPLPCAISTAEGEPVARYEYDRLLARSIFSIAATLGTLVCFTVIASDSRWTSKYFEQGKSEAVTAVAVIGGLLGAVTVYFSTRASRSLRLTHKNEPVALIKQNHVFRPTILVADERFKVDTTTRGGPIVVNQAGQPVMQFHHPTGRVLAIAHASKKSPEVVAEFVSDAQGYSLQPFVPLREADSVVLISAWCLIVLQTSVQKLHAR